MAISSECWVGWGGGGRRGEGGGKFSYCGNKIKTPCELYKCYF